TCTKAVLGAPPVSHNEQGDFGTTANDCMHWCIIYPDGTYDAFETQAQMDTALAVIGEPHLYAGPDSGPVFSGLWRVLRGVRPRLTTHIICAG
ncbi:hypothetical protein, partial [Streptococcus pseudopneumoniae]|uniref:hypothetical protein n=1 Tax=Streptococcus pseudopneumoniae TaxID=257758 RepID=UPI0018B06A25